MATEHYDLIVIGAGPAGSVLAALVAEAGNRVLLIDREQLPRYQIGESLLPATLNGIAELLGVREQMDNAGFVLKRGATFHWGSSPDLWTLNFGGAPHDTLPGPDWPTALNVRRDRFDAILLDRARQAGVTVREQQRAMSFIVDNGRVCGVHIRDADDHDWSASASWTVGATGQASPLAALIGRRQTSAFFRNASVFGYFEHGKRLPSPLEGNVLLESFDDGWIWYIPLSDELTSVGAVLYHPAVSRLRNDHESVLLDVLSRCTYASEYLKDARLVPEGQYAGMRVRREFSYANTRFWMPGALVVGDSACFIDVILSSGVHLATFGALQAARAINTALRGDLPEESCLDEFELRYRLEFTKFYQGLMGLHDMGRDSNTYRLWLRSMLQRTQGIFLDDEPELPAGRRSPSAVAAQYLREHNVTMLDDAGPPTMEDIVPVPEIFGELVPDSGQLHWRRANE